MTGFDALIDRRSFRAYLIPQSIGKINVMKVGFVGFLYSLSHPALLGCIFISKA